MENFTLSAELVWFLIGLALLLLELLTPGLVLVFFGAGAWITALAVLIFEPTLNAQLLIFLISSVLSLALLRKSIKTRFANNRKETDTADLEEDYVGKIVQAIEDFDNHGRGRVSFRGSTWQATASGPVAAGQSLIIRKFDSILLHVDPIAQNQTKTA